MLAQLGIHDLSLFITAGLLLNIMPGPDSLLIFAQGFLTNILNPKVALFFLAFMPHFIAAGAPHKALAFIVLGCIFNVNAMLWCNALALGTARASARIERNPAATQWLNRATGCLFAWLGVKLALARQN